jgi:hypothetical protein
MKIPLFLLLSFLLFSCTSTETPEAPPALGVGELIDLQLAGEVHDFHEEVKSDRITTRRFKHADVASIIKGLDPSVFEVKTAGRSIEGRDIYLVKYGQGPVKVLLWSQMHGNEPTATMALMDLFNFLQEDEAFPEFKAMLHNELSLYFIPMLNPDGAEYFERRNALGVDLNRDALRLQSPEAQLLKSVRDSLDADWGFNLHDQNRYYAAGIAPYTASISFLAPAYNYEKEVDEKRGDAMQLISAMNEVLQQYIPNMVGRYSDAFEPRAFGDNIQKWGTRTILIESGSIKDDREKQQLRRLNFTILLTAYNEIAKGTFDDIPLAAYDRIPYNNSNAFNDFIIRKATVMIDDQPYVIDLAFRHREVDDEGNESFHFRSSITDLGDLSTSYAYNELDAEGLILSPGKVYPDRVRNERRLERLDPVALLKQGYTQVYMKEPPKAADTDQLPLVISANENPEQEIKVGENPSMVLRDENGTVKYAVINGFLWDLAKEEMIRSAWSQ